MIPAPMPRPKYDTLDWGTSEPAIPFDLTRKSARHLKVVEQAFVLDAIPEPAIEIQAPVEAPRPRRRLRAFLLATFASGVTFGAVFAAQHPAEIAEAASEMTRAVMPVIR